MAAHAMPFHLLPSVVIHGINMMCSSLPKMERKTVRTPSTRNPAQRPSPHLIPHLPQTSTNPLNRPPPININLDTSNEPRIVTGQKNTHATDIVGLGEAAHGDIGHKFSSIVGRVVDAGEGAEQARPAEQRVHAVDPDLLCCVFGGEAFRCLDTRRVSELIGTGEWEGRVSKEVKRDGG